MKIVALKTFKSRELGRVVRYGQEIDVSAEYGRNLIANRLATTPDKRPAQVAEVSREIPQSVTRAPRPAPTKTAGGRKPTTRAPEVKDADGAPSSAAGEEQPSSASQAARRSRSKTSSSSGSGASGGEEE